MADRRDRKLDLDADLPATDVVSLVMAGSLAAAFVER
jgi:hypothetical protein